MNKIMPIRILLVIALITLMLGCATTSGVKDADTREAPAVITDVRIQDEILEIKSDKPFVYTIYSSDPYRISLDIPDMTAGGFGKKIVSEKAGFSEISLQQTDGPRPSVNVAVLLQTPSSVIPSYKDNTLTLNVKHEEPAASAEIKAEHKVPETLVAVNPGPPEPSPAPAPEQKAPEGTMPKATEVSSVELKKSGDSVKVLITGNGTMMPNVFPLDEKIVVDIPGVTMRASIPNGVVNPLKGIRAGKHRDKVRLVLDLKEKTTFDVVSKENSIEISFQKNIVAKAQPTAEGDETGKGSQETVGGEAARAENVIPLITSAPETPEGKYRGKKISLDFQDADIGPIFRLLADVNGYNLVLDPSIRGKVTIKLMNVPWDQALDIILNNLTPPLSHRVEGNILWIAPASKFESLVELENKARETREKAEDLVQEVIRINYASASDIQTAITSGKLLSPRGTITPDSRMNTLIVKDTQTSIEKVKDLMKIMDVSKPQVMIEAKIVTVGTSYTENLGIRWGGSFQGPGRDFSGDFSVNTPVDSAGPQAGVRGGTVAFNIGSANTFSVNVSLSALETIGKARTLSNPKILTMDNEQAKIEQGQTVFVQQVSQSGTTSQAQSATLSLTVTPKITPDGYVLLKVDTSDDSVDTAGAAAGANPVLNTRKLKTQALVKNGETLVIGGIYTIIEDIDYDQVPILGKIPGLGWLFKTKSQTGPNVNELLIFITPVIVGQQL